MNELDFARNLDKYYQKIMGKALTDEYSHSFLRKIKPEYEVYKYFYKGYFLKNKKIFQKTRSHDLYFNFIGEVYRYLLSNPELESYMFFFYPDKKEVDTARSVVLFALFKMLSDVLVFDGLKDLKFHDNFKFDIETTTPQNIDTRLDFFIRKLDSICASKKAAEHIFHQKARKLLNQSDALFFSKKEVPEVIDYCKKRQKTGIMKTFDDEKKFVKSAKKLFEMTKFNLKIELLMGNDYSDELLEQELIEKRISLKSSLRYLKYLAFMNVISKRVNRPVEINSIKEAAVFKQAYRYFRDAAVELKWLACTDSTYCKGVRSKTFHIKVLGCQKMKIDKNLSLNNLEEQYKNYSIVRKSQFVIRFEEDTEQYLNERCQIVEKKKEIVYKNKESQKSYHAYNQIGYSDTFQKLYKKAQWQTNLVEARAYKMRFKKEQGAFMAKYSDSYYNRGKDLLEYYTRIVS